MSINVPDSSAKFADSLHENCGLSTVMSSIPALTAIAAELFGKSRIEVTPDPELEDTQYVVVSVVASGSPREVADCRREWYRRTDAILGENCDKVQLLIDIRE